MKMNARKIVVVAVFDGPFCFFGTIGILGLVMAAIGVFGLEQPMNGSLILGSCFLVTGVLLQVWFVSNYRSQ